MNDGSAVKRSAAWYNSPRWRQKRLDQLHRHPLCASCLAIGTTSLASVADHKVPHREDEDLFWQGDLQSLCATCHNSYKQRLEKSGVAQGCSDDGRPLDPNHHWNR